MEEIIAIAGLPIFGVPNRNGIIYPKEVFDEAVKNYQEQIDNGTAVGYLGQADFSLNNVSHQIVGIYEKDNRVYYKIRILDTPSGKIAKEMLKEQNMTLGLHSIASVKDKIVQKEGFEILSVDLIEDEILP